MAIEEFFNVEKEGVIKTKAAGSRVFFMATRGWAVIEKQLFSVFSSGASVMLSEMGVGYGRGVAKEVLAVTQQPDIVLKVLEELSQAAGWGVIEVKGDVQVGEKIEVVISRCAFCAEGEVGTQPRCHFISGVVTGAASEAFGATFKATEDECMRKGDHVCAIRLERVQTPTQ